MLAKAKVENKKQISITEELNETTEANEKHQEVKNKNSNVPIFYPRG